MEENASRQNATLIQLIYHFSFSEGNMFKLIFKIIHKHMKKISEIGSELIFCFWVSQFVFRPGSCTHFM